MHKYTIEFLASAWDDLDEIADMHLNLVGVKSAQKITDRILNTIELLADNPYIGIEPKYPMIADRGFRVLICDKYLCFYKIGVDFIMVYHIADGRKDYQKLF